jgi:hypothetical protein
MDKFEYKEVYVDVENNEQFLVLMNNEGVSGWQAVHFYYLGNYRIVLMMRKITT